MKNKKMRLCHQILHLYFRDVKITQVLSRVASWVGSLEASQRMQTRRIARELDTHPSQLIEFSGLVAALQRGELRQEPLHVHFVRQYRRVQILISLILLRLLRVLVAETKPISP